jgi:hypothetical protein
LFVAGNGEEVPEFVFLAHCIDGLSSLQIGFCLRTFSAHPYEAHWFIWFVFPPMVIALPIFWSLADTFVAHKYYLHKLKCMAWIVPRHGFHVITFSKKSLIPCFEIWLFM